MDRITLGEREADFGAPAAANCTVLRGTPVATLPVPPVQFLWLNMLPEARKAGTLVQESGDELLVYDVERDQAHCLNAVTTLVWRYADGKTPVPSLVERIRQESPAEIDETTVWLALVSLSGAHLLVKQVERSVLRAAFARRQLARA